MNLKSILKYLKEYGGYGVVIVISIISAAISYGSSQATASNNITNIQSNIAGHELRINKVEKDDEEYGKQIAAMNQHITDIWHDMGHKD